MHSDLDLIGEEFPEDEGIEGILTEYRIREIKKFIRGKYILDIGCGVGTLEEALDENHYVVGIDGSAAKIGKAISKDYKCKTNFIFGQIEDFNLSMEFDTIVMANILEHLSNPVLTLNHLKKFLSEDGIFIITVPNAVSFHKQVALKSGFITDYFRLTKSDIRKGHKNVFDKTRLQRCVRAAGLKIYGCKGFFFKPLPNIFMEKIPKNIFNIFYEIGNDFGFKCSSLIIIAGNE